MKGGIGLIDKKALLIATNLTSICCVYQEKIDKDVSYRRAYENGIKTYLNFNNILIQSSEFILWL